MSIKHIDVTHAQQWHCLELTDISGFLFGRFRETCVNAYLVLRRNCNFLITLFLMMMNTGLPEVSCLEDVEYLRKTLVPNVSEEEAVDFFKAKFQEALHYGWKASANNVFHLFRVGWNGIVYIIWCMVVLSAVENWAAELFGILWNLFQNSNKN